MKTFVSQQVDKCMRIMIEYNFVPGVEVADYLRYTVELGKMCGVKVKSKKAEMEAYKKKLALKRAKKIKEKEEAAENEGEATLKKENLTKRRSSMQRRQSSVGSTLGKDDSSDSDSDSVSTTGSSSSGSSSSSYSSSSSSSSSEEDKTPRTKERRKAEKASAKAAVKAKVEAEKKAAEAEEKMKKKKKTVMNSGKAEYGGVKKNKKKNAGATSKAPRRTKRQLQVIELARKLHLDPKDPYVQTYFPALATESKAANTKKAVTNFKNAGFKSNIRKGIAEKDHGRIPALLPLPDCYSTGPVQEESEKSYLGAKIMNDLRAAQVDDNTGGIRREAVPLFHRVSMDEGETYSDILGRPFHYIDPNRTHKPKLTDFS